MILSVTIIYAIFKGDNYYHSHFIEKKSKIQRYLGPYPKSPKLADFRVGIQNSLGLTREAKRVTMR